MDESPTPTPRPPGPPKKMQKPKSFALSRGFILHGVMEEKSAIGHNHDVRLTPLGGQTFGAMIGSLEKSRASAPQTGAPGYLTICAEIACFRAACEDAYQRTSSPPTGYYGFVRMSRAAVQRGTAPAPNLHLRTCARACTTVPAFPGLELRTPSLKRPQQIDVRGRAPRPAAKAA